MKINYIANARIPTEKAHGIQIMKMCEAFAQLGNDVTLILPRRIQNREFRLKNPFEYYNVKPIFKIKKLPCIDLLPLFSNPLAFYIQATSFALATLFYSLFTKEDLVYTRDEFSASLLCKKKKVIYEAHVYPQSKHKWFARWLKSVKKIVVINNALKKQFSKLAPSEKIAVAHDGVDLKTFKQLPEKHKAKTALKINSKTPVAMYTGHLYPWKGVDTILDTAKKLPKVMFYVVGGTSKDVKEYHEKIQQKELKNVTLTGHVQHTQIPEFLAAADVLLLPNSAKYNISNEYTSPLKLFEYMAAKRPILASDVTSTKEILEHGKNAILFKADDPYTCAQSLKHLLQNSKLASNLVKSAYKDVRPYTWELRAKKVLNT